MPITFGLMLNNDYRILVFIQDQTILMALAVGMHEFR